MSSRLRLFIAIDPPRETAAHAARIIERLRRAGVEAAWVDPARMHLTLHFLGNDVDEADLHGICVAMDAAATMIRPFDIAFGGVGVFPRPDAPRVVWLGIQEGSAALASLYDALGAGLEPLGFPPEERGYRPHLTLGRIRSARGRPDGKAAIPLAAELAKLADEPCGSGRVTAIALYASRRAEQGSEYDRLHVAPLRGE